MKRFLFIAAMLTTMVFLSSCVRWLRDLDLNSDQICAEYPLFLYDNNGGYNREAAANDYFLFSLASLESYGKFDYVPKQFNMESYDPSWVKISNLTYDGELTDGLFYEVYIRDSETVDVILAIRGTSNTIDWLSNTSWISGIFPISNQYDIVAKEFSTLRNTIIEKYHGRVIRFVATGHSLGGALAVHLAFGFSCTSAVVFDTSPVYNKFYYKSPRNPHVVNIYDQNDELGIIRRFTAMAYETSNRRKYNQKIDLGPGIKLHHSMFNLSVSMARIIAHCQTEVESGLRISCWDPTNKRYLENPLPKRLYCSTFGWNGRDPKACGA